MKVKSKDTFAILHLSDLHIVAHNGNNYSIVLKRMLDHIQEITERLEKIIIVFTGDLVEKGEFEKARPAICKFFIDLKERLGNKVVDIVCVPGNHDKKRGRLVLGPNVKEGEETFWETFEKEDWSYFENQFSDYKEVVAHIQKNIFKVCPQGASTYGIRQITIEDNCTICFLCFNSAWACTGEDDEGNLRIGKFQLDDMMSKYQKNKKNTDLVIGLMHHPTDWLTKIEQKYLNQYMTDEYRLNTNIMLQGHIHEKETCNWYNQNHSLTTLVTGMGWDQQKEINEGGHRYSLYKINMESCIVKANTYVTDKNGKFNEDTAVYNGENIIFPLFVHRFLELNNLKFKKSEIPLFYPNYNPAENLGLIVDRVNDFLFTIMEKMRNIQFDWIYYQSIQAKVKELFQLVTLSDIENDRVQAVRDIVATDNITTDDNEFNKILDQIRGIDEFGKLYYGNKNNLFELKNMILRIAESIQSNEEIGDTKEMQIHMSEFLDKDRKIYLKNKLYAFVGDFCIGLAAKLFPKAEFEDGDAIRVHFRIISVDTDEKVMYKKLFAHTIIKEDSEIKYMSEEAKLTDIKYENSMIQKSFNENKTMLFSLNPSSNNHISKSDWIDFITIAPKIECNKYLLGDDCEELYYPYISFGVSVNSKEFQKTLRGITYVDFDKILSRLLRKFCNIIPVDFKDIMKERK